jgi:hypothetical protein
VVELLGVGAAGRTVQTRRQVILQVTGKQNAADSKSSLWRSKTSLAGVKADMNCSSINSGGDYSRLMAQIRHICYIARLRTGVFRYDIPTRLAITAAGHYPVVAASPDGVAGRNRYLASCAYSSGDGGGRTASLNEPLIGDILRA